MSDECSLRIIVISIPGPDFVQQYNLNNPVLEDVSEAGH